MTYHKLGFLLLAGLVLAPAARAQEEGTAVAFAAYFKCDQSREARTDTIWQQMAAPIWQRQVDAGLINSFGWARHWAGGEWRRLNYIVGTDMAAMTQAREAYIEEVTGDHREAAVEFNSICPSHDDYIWFQAASSQAPEEMAQDRAEASLSSYMQCDDREAQADEIVETAFAPILNGHVAAGRINSWSWLEHFVGGKYRRALVYDAADYNAVLSFWSTLWESLEAEQPELLRTFGSICHSHSDYIWDLSLNP